ncbi:MAG: hypothetical protein ACRCSU_04510 [Paracoccaceae bacterium]
MLDQITAQLTDPFRIVLLIGLFVTMARTEAATGRWLPLALGIAFVAALIPLTIQRPEGSVVTPILTGLVANVVIVALILLAHGLWKRSRGG